MKKALMFILLGLLSINVFARDFVMPRALTPGARIAIITPASATDSIPVVKAMKYLSAKGFQPVLYGHVHGHQYGTFAANDTVRAIELMSAFRNSEIDAILCTRGGYGTVRMLPLIDIEEIMNNPKWLIGFSDISIIHALMYHSGISSIHGPMCAYLGDEKADTISKNLLMEMISQEKPFRYDMPYHPYNNTGKSSGILIGGNLITINGLSETEYDVLNLPEENNCILYIEEVGEKIHAVERMLMRLHQSGALSKYKGLIIGEFTEYKPTKDFSSMEDMIYYWLKEWGYYELEDFPIVFEFPAGHGDINYPLILNAPITLEVTDYGYSIIWE